MQRWLTSMVRRSTKNALWDLETEIFSLKVFDKFTV